MTCRRFKTVSAITILAYLPASKEPISSRTPMLTAGLMVAARIACSFGTPISTALRMQSYRFVALPAMVPSASVASGPLNHHHPSNGWFALRL